ncbi:hypothetical protein ACEUZ9_005428 [Paracoccus litorisediminis]|uniref:hypothetical protein n=1 Tax=Paracoccus litorisediminis TaxID=2006130 RepID=UPI00372EB62F
MGVSSTRLGPVTRVIDALSGLNGAYPHLFQGGIVLSEPSPFGLCGHEVLRRAIADFSAHHPDLGFQSDPEDAPLGREILYEFCPDNPLMITSVGYHTPSANSAALQRAALMHGRQ